jgi:hypothetical protein
MNSISLTLTTKELASLGSHYKHLILTVSGTNPPVLTLSDLALLAKWLPSNITEQLIGICINSAHCQGLAKSQKD